jgi:hypothetical protein
MEVEICFSFGSHGQADEGLVQDHHDLGKRVADFQLVEQLLLDPLIQLVWCWFGILQLDVKVTHILILHVNFLNLGLIKASHLRSEPIFLVEAWSLWIILSVDIGEVVYEDPAFTSMLEDSAISVSLPRHIV